MTDKNIIGNVSADIQYASIFDQYLNNISQSYPNNTYATLGMPTAGYIS